jgi:hypothetical protein
MFGDGRRTTHFHAYNWEKGGKYFIQVLNVSLWVCFETIFKKM